MMAATFDVIDVEQHGDVFGVRLKRRRLTEPDQLRFGDEIGQLITVDKCRRLALGLGEDQLDCLYSMFLGKLVTARRQIQEVGGHMHLCEVGPASLGVLKTCRLTELFEIHPSMDDAIKVLASLH